ncbi:heat shock factor-binding protein 1-like [Limulus polyphemus]|uniref:Heat shock factor-binding protein 1-like n=1 Tax=Limulus polyphemus TaxID=6850 RepID=A0ABM1BN05_LIMPO|nr:heat shock factor-binding protein 1-like [Limulus polyphemus]
MAENRSQGSDRSNQETVEISKDEYPGDHKGQEPKNLQDLVQCVQTLLQGMQDKFQGMSDQILARIDEMGHRIDDLEKNIADIMMQSGTEEGDKGVSGS